MSEYKELRCFCSRKPLLATYGIDRAGKLYVHIKIYKQRRIFGEILCTEGSIQVRCRECLRWHKVNIRNDRTVSLSEISDPLES